MFEDFDILQVLASVPAIVGFVILLVNRAKVWLASTPVSIIPIWVIACVLSALLTTASYYFGVLKLAENETLFAIVQRSFVLAAAASGFREWWGAGLLKPMGQSSDAMDSRLDKSGV